jgi:hypothetical protein
MVARGALKGSMGAQPLAVPARADAVFRAIEATAKHATAEMRREKTS